METENPRERLKRWLASGEARLQPLTFPQREIWENSPVPPGHPANHVCSYFELNGPVEFDELERAVGRVAQRQEAMRTSFLPGKERPLQIIRATARAIVEHRVLKPDEHEGEGLEAVMVESFRKPFDFLREPLYRVVLLQRDEDDFVLAFTIHHAVADGWTLGVFIQDLCAAYIIGLRESGKVPGLGEIKGLRESMPPVSMSCTEWGAVERARWTPAALAGPIDYWRGRLEGSQRMFEGEGTPADRELLLSKWITSLPPELADGVRELAKREGCTPYTTLLAAFQIALHRWRGVEDILVGTPVAHRNKSKVAETMGYFSGVVPLRGRVAGGRGFGEHLREVHESTMDDFAHAVPFAELAAALPELCPEGGHPVYDVRFALQNHPVPDIELPGISTSLRTWSTGTVRSDLTCELTDEDGGYEIVWLHHDAIVPRSEVEALDLIYRDVLLAAVAGTLESA